ncbi:glycosyltransferase [Enterovibrio sp. 27052020O]|uniref:glycosyltransferase n=1 Tax=Enterovibrio sp. 27052020O TaxID=3241166 RepID=UPI003890F1F4
MEYKKVVYIISPRSAFPSKPGRKISEIIKCWGNKYSVSAFFGGQLIKGAQPQSYGNVGTHKQSYRKNFFLSPLVHTVSEVKDFIHCIKSYIYLRKKHNGDNISLVWERSSRFHFAGFLLARDHDVPYVLEWKDHLVDYNISLFKPLALYVEHLKCKWATSIVVESLVIKKALVAIGYEESKIIVAYNAVNYEEFSLTTPEYETSPESQNDGKIKLAYLGSYAFYHDAERLVYAAKLLLDKGFENKLVIYMVGDGKERQHCKEISEKLGIPKDFLEFVDPILPQEVASFLAKIDISVLPGSTDIIAPIKVLEYMAAGTATIVPNHECNREIITDLENGILFSAKCEKDLADKIQYLVENESEIERISFNASNTANRNFSWENTWLKALDEVLVDNEYSY